MTTIDFETRAYDRLLHAATAQLTAPPRLDLALAAKEAGVPIEDARRWFAGAEALSAAVIEHQMVLLTDYLIRRATAVPNDDLVAQLRELTHAYITWFFDNPVGGRLLVSPPAMAFASRQDVRSFSDSIYDLARSMMERARDGGLIRADIDIPEVMLSMRALTLGVVLLQDLDHAGLWGDTGDSRSSLMCIVDRYFDLATQEKGKLQPQRVVPQMPGATFTERSLKAQDGAVRATG